MELKAGIMWAISKVEAEAAGKNAATPSVPWHCNQTHARL